MPLQPQPQDWTEFLTFDDPPPASAAVAAHLSSTQQQHSAWTPGASTSSGDADSPGVHSDSLSLSLSTDPSTALTSLTSSPSSSSGPFLAFPRSMDPNGNSGKLPEGLEQLAASWQAHQQALAFHAQAAAAAAAAAAQAGQGGGVGADGSAPPSGTTTPLPPPLGGLNYAPAIPPLYIPTPGTFPGQLPPEWIAAANAAQSFPTAPTPANFTGYPTFPAQLPASTAPTSPSTLPTIPLVGLNHLGQLAPNPAVDPNLYALHMTLEAQARIAAAAVANHQQQQQQQQQGGSPTASSVPPSSSSAHARTHSGPAGKRNSSYLKAAHGLSIAAHQRSKTGPSQHSSPLASPSMLPPLPNVGDVSGAYGFPPVASTSAAPATHQRPVPPLPPARSAAGSAAPSTVSSPQAASPSLAAYGLPSLFPYPNPYAAALAGYPTSVAPSPAHVPSYPPSQAQSPHPVVDYDFSSLEQDLDRFSSLGGFASAAAAAMASVSPTSTHHPLPSTSSSTYTGASLARPSDAYNIGGYGGSSTPRIAPEALPSPKVLTDVLADPLFFPAPSSASASAKGSSPAASAGSVGNKSAAGLSAAGGLAAASPGTDSQASPAGSTVLDEDSAEALSRKDPIAAQVWRMFHKAKNTMPNGARMENLTWRLMSMTLRKRREDSASAVASAVPSAAPSQAPSPGAEEARTQRALEAALEEQREKNEERDVVQPLTRGAPPGRMRGPGGGRDRSDSSGQARGRPSFGMTAAQEQQQKEEDERGKEDAEGEDEERGRRRRTKSGTASKSNSATPEADEVDDMMDWRAMSKSRSRSRAPDMMDWRAASRSRSRAPDFRVSVALPAIDSTPAVGNFSRFFNDTGIPSSINNEMPPPPVPSSHSSSSSAVPAAVSIAPTTSAPPAVAPLAIPSSLSADLDENAALAELATSLGLSPQDQANLFGSATARLDGHSLLDLPSPGAIASPPLPLAGLASPNGLPSSLSASPHPSFHFPQPDAQNGGGSGPDPNLAAIENTLNQLISLQNLAGPGQQQGQGLSTSPNVSVPPGPLPILPHDVSSSSFSTSVKSPLSASYTVSGSTESNSTATTQPPSGQHSRADSLSSSLPASAGKGSLAQQNLQQLISGRKASNAGASTSSASSSRRASAASSSSPYLNATTLAQSSRPYSFGAAASVAAAAATNAAPASGLSLNRPSQLPQPDPSSHPPTPYSETPTPHFFPSSAPVQPAAFGSPNPPLFGDGTDTAHLLYDYFHSQHNAAPFLPSPYINGSQLDTFGSAPSGGIDPSQLLASFGGGPASAAAAASPYGSDASSWGISPRSAIDSPAAVSPEDDNGKKGNKARRPTAVRANSASNIPTTTGGSSLKGKAHARSNTISLPSTIQEGKPLELDSADASPADSSKGSSSKAAAKKVDSEGGPTKCLNCQTTNTPLWRRDSEGRPLCNACGLFRNLHGVDRPANLNTGVIKKRNRKSGPKDPNSKKASSRAAARRNSASAAAAAASASGAAAGTSAQGSAPANSRKERAGAGAPYPNAAARAAQQQQE